MSDSIKNSNSQHVQGKTVGEEITAADKEFRTAQAKHGELVRELPALQKKIIEVGADIQKAVQGDHTPAQKEVYRSFTAKQTQLLEKTKEGIEKPLKSNLLTHQIEKGESAHIRAVEKQALGRKRFFNLFLEKTPKMREKETLKEVGIQRKITKELSSQNTEAARRIGVIKTRTERLHNATALTMNALSDINKQRKQIDEQIKAATKTNKKTYVPSAPKGIANEISRLKSLKKELNALEKEIKSEGFEAVNKTSEYSELMGKFEKWGFSTQKDSPKEGKFVGIQNETKKSEKNVKDYSDRKDAEPRPAWYMRIFGYTPKKVAELSFRTPKVIAADSESPKLSTTIAPKSIKPEAEAPQESLSKEATLNSFSDLKEVVDFRSKTINSEKAQKLLKKELTLAQKNFAQASKSPETMNQLTDFYTTVRTLTFNSRDPVLNNFLKSKDIVNFNKEFEMKFPQTKLLGDFYLKQFAKLKIELPGFEEQLKKRKLELDVAERNFEKIKLETTDPEKIKSEQTKLEKQQSDYKGLEKGIEKRKDELSNRKELKEMIAHYEKVGELPAGKLKDKLLSERNAIESLVAGTLPDELQFCEQWVQENKAPDEFLQGIVSSYTLTFGSDHLVAEGVDTSKLQQSLDMLKTADPNNSAVYERLKDYSIDAGKLVNLAHEEFYKKNAQGKFETKNMKPEDFKQLQAEISTQSKAYIEKYKDFRVPSNIATSLQCIELRVKLNILVQKIVPEQIAALEINSRKDSTKL